MGNSIFQEGILHLKSLLSQVECAKLLELAEEKGYREQVFEPPYVPEARQRAMFNDTDIAALLTSRILPHLPPLSAFYKNAPLPQEAKKQLFATWQPLSINERLRFYRYAAGERFAPHMDHEFAKNEYERTFLSVVLYLNDDFEGGETQFSESAIKPVSGDCIVYAHEKMHEGAIVKQGTKIILRTDVFYRQS